MPDTPALARIEHCHIDLTGAAFAPHRHDVYTLALPTRGIQTFDYRGATRRARPGEVVVLHPDELHDGRPGDERGFSYAAVAVPPELIARSRSSGALPFVSGGVRKNRRLFETVQALLHLSETGQADRLELDTLLAELAHALDMVGDAPAPAAPLAVEAVERASRHIRENSVDGVSLDALEALTGIDRWQLCRDFRALRGTSPYRYLTLRRIDHARDEIRRGASLAEAALAAGFSDQAHMSRQFKAATGLTPRQWRSLTARTIVQDRPRQTRQIGLH